MLNFHRLRPGQKLMLNLYYPTGKYTEKIPCNTISPKRICTGFYQADIPLNATA